jgi:uncharacterized membrane protein
VGRWLRVCGAGLLTAVVLDGLWLGVVMKTFYRDGLAPVARLASDGSLAPIWAAALPVYLFLVAGNALFVLPRAGASGWPAVAAWGGLFGFLTYGVYDLTNLSTLRAYPLSLAMVDIAWGALATAIVSVVMRAAMGSGPAGVSRA